MKKIIYAVFFSILFLNTSAQFIYQWANAAGSSGAEYGQAVATDASGNVYVAGVFTGTIDFSTSTPAYTLTTQGSKDIFLAKYNPSGNLVYAKNMGGTNDDVPLDIYVNANAVYIVGKFIGTCDFDPNLNIKFLTSNGGGTDGDGFCAKYDLDGNYQWAFQIGGIGNDRIEAITGDTTGDIIIAGFFNNTANFNPNGTVNLTSSGNGFFAKYTSAGAYVFVKQLTGNYGDPGDIKLDASGNIYLAGGFSETVDFDPSGSSATMTTSGVVQIDGFFAKYTSSGSYIWAKRIGGNGVDLLTQIAITPNYIFVGGEFSTTCDVDPATPGTVNLISKGAGDFFFGRYDLNGIYQFAYGIGGVADNDYLNGLAIDANDNILITGKFTGTNVNFSTTGGSFVTLFSGSNTGYIAQYAADGHYVNANSLGNAGSEGKGIVVTSSSVYYTGSFQGTVDFDFSSVGTANLISKGSNDIFVSKLNYSGITGVLSNQNEHQFLVYPNPSNGVFSIKSETDKLEVMNSLGQTVYQTIKQTTDVLSVDLSNQPAGIYFIKINVGDKFVQQKIIIQ